MFERSNTKTKLIIACVVAGLMALLYFGVYWGHQYAQNAVDQSEREAQEAQAEQLSASEIKALLADTKSEQLTIGTFFLTSDRVVDFLEELEHLATSTNLESQTNSVTDASWEGLESSKWEALSVSLSTKGSWQNSYRFLGLLERLPYRSSITRVTLQKIEEEKGSASWQADISLLVLKQK